MSLTTKRAVNALVLGYPRIGRRRELKKLTEAHWAGQVDAAELLAAAALLRQENWKALVSAGIGEVPVNDFSLYDHVADTIQMVGAVPERHRSHVADSLIDRQRARLAEYFAMARGTTGAPALEMTKWFDTNYHYLIPELGPETAFTLNADKPSGEVREAQRMGVDPRPVVLGPVTFLSLAKPGPGLRREFSPFELLPRLLPIYEELLTVMAGLGVEWVQLDEPVLAADPDVGALDAAREALERLSAAPRRPKLLIATYFGTVTAALPTLRRSAVDAVAIDFTGPAAGNLELLATTGGLPGKRVVAGVVDGRNVWINDLADSADILRRLRPLAEEVVVGTSCSLMHVPVDVRLESRLPADVKDWLAFAEQKLDEVALLARATMAADAATAARFAANTSLLHARRQHPLTHDPAVRSRLAAVGGQVFHRRPDAATRAVAQQERLTLPLLPTTTIGSFPQTPELRASRAALREGTINEEQYRDRIAAEIEHVVAVQHALDLDVFVHGEPERNDMVQYFAEHLAGFLTTDNGWVQSYGSRYVRPPILAGDVSRPARITVDWTSYAQGLTPRPVKGMLTGPITMLAWSFVRDDQPLEDTARQIALALRDEIADLEAAGIGIIQVDEPGLRELLPLQRESRSSYLRWACGAFRLVTSAARADTQIHTHMCYAEFGDILDAISDLDIDVISLEAARSHAQTIEELGPGEPARPGGLYAVGPGVYDIHSPQIPTIEHISTLLRRALEHLPASRLWVNPDCGLKTRTEPEVVASLNNMVQAAHAIRSELSNHGLAGRT